MKNVSIIGAGGHTRSMINVLENNGYAIRGVYEDHFYAGEMIGEYAILGRIVDIPADEKVVLSIGDNARRATLFKKFNLQILKENLIHKRSELEKHVELGFSNQILALAYINSYVVIGANNIINTRATLEHEVRIGNHNHVSVGASLCGRVSVGSNCFIGAGSVVIDRISICDSVTVGANAVVVENIETPGTYVGVPARKIK